MVSMESYKKTRSLNEKDIQIIDNNDDIVRLRVLVQSWGSPEKKDLVGDYFTPETDFCDEDVKVLKAMYDHGMSENPYMSAREGVIGRATLDGSDEVGRWFTFELKRQNKYTRFIEELAKMGVLGASTQAFPGGVIRDEDGKLLMWNESEATLCVMPADVTTIGKVAVLAKSLGIEESIMSGNGEKIEVQQGSVESVTYVATDATIASTGETVVPGTFEETIGNMIKEADASATADPVVQVLNGLMAQITALREDMARDVATVRTQVSELQAVQKSQGEGLILSLKDTQKGVAAFADYVTKRLGLEVKSASLTTPAPSSAEIEAVTESTRTKRAQINSYFFDNAPGA